MRIPSSGILRKVFGPLLIGMALIALSGCYPYYYDHHHDYGYSHSDRGYHGDQYRHQHDRWDHDRRDRDDYR